MTGRPVTREEVEAGRLENLKARGSDFVASQATQHSVQLSIPWQYLVPDNAKYGVIKGRMLLRAPYRAAKDTIQHIARRAMQGRPMLEGDLIWEAKLYMPDARRRDATNYAKLCQDSCQGSIYADDTQIKQATWINAGICRENPRCDIRVRVK